MTKKLSDLLKEYNGCGLSGKDTFLEEYKLAKELEDKVQSLVDERNSLWFRIEELTEQRDKLNSILTELTREF